MLLIGRNTEKCQIRRPIPQGQEVYATNSTEYDSLPQAGGAYQKIYDNLPIVFNEKGDQFDEQGFPLTEAIYYGTVQVRANRANKIRTKDIVFRRSLASNGSVDMTPDAVNRPELSQDQLMVTGIHSFNGVIRLILVNKDKFNTPD